jgi:hypothetical protein
VKDDCGSVAATPLISRDIVDGPTFVSPSAAAAAATAVFAAPFITSIQPWEMTASCLSLLAAAAAHYPHLVSLLSNHITSLIAVVIVITAQVLKYLPESLRCVDSLEQGATHCLHPTFCCNKLQHTSPFLFPHCCSSYFSFIRILRRAAGAVAVRQHRYHWCSELFTDRRSHHSTHARYFVPQPTAWVLPFAKNTSLR